MLWKNNPHNILTIDWEMLLFYKCIGINHESEPRSEQFITLGDKQCICFDQYC